MQDREPTGNPEIHDYNPAYIHPQTYEDDPQGQKSIIEAMIQDVADNGGEYTFKTVRGRVQDVHRTE